MKKLLTIVVMTVFIIGSCVISGYASPSSPGGGTEERSASKINSMKEWDGYELLF